MTINERIEDIEVKFYGSYEIGLSLHCNDLDMMLIQKIIFEKINKEIF